jgi:hypothetical protein
VSLAPAFAVATLLPVLFGPLPAESPTLNAELCGGGTITIPLGKNDEEKRDCHPKACHAGTCRERSKRQI